MRRGVVEYLVKWLNWPEEDSTWENEEALEDAQEIIADWNREQDRLKAANESAEPAAPQRKRTAQEKPDLPEKRMRAAVPEVSATQASEDEVAVLPAVDGAVLVVAEDERPAASSVAKPAAAASRSMAEDAEAAEEPSKDDVIETAAATAATATAGIIPGASLAPQAVPKLQPGMTLKSSALLKSATAFSEQRQRTDDGLGSDDDSETTDTHKETRQLSSALHKTDSPATKSRKTVSWSPQPERNR